MKKDRYKVLLRQENNSLLPLGIKETTFDNPTEIRVFENCKCIVIPGKLVNPEKILASFTLIDVIVKLKTENTDE